MDRLTGVLGRQGFTDSLAAVLGEPEAGQAGAAGAARHVLYLLVLDLDRFKSVNDSTSVKIGDEVLARAAARIAKHAGQEALIGRLSGDEFGILIGAGSHTHGQGPEDFAARLLELLSRPYAVQGHIITLSASIGTAVWPDDGAGGDALLQAATLALHDGERRGRGMQTAFVPAMRESAALKAGLEFELRAALTLQQIELQAALPLNQFVLHYQPQLDIVTGVVCGFEALIRWQHPTRGLLTPNAFIPLAEENGLIHQLGLWVLRTACLAAMSWPKNAAGGEIGVAVNVSPLQLEGGFAADVALILRETALPPERLCLEVTEAAALGEGGAALTALSTLGLHLALDDFGTGYASLTSLLQYGFSQIKVDYAFIHALRAQAEGDVGPRSDKAAFMVKAVANLGSWLGIGTIAEGVETLHQLDQVTELGIEQVQGYLISPAVAQDEVAGLLSRLAAAHTQAVPT